MAPPTVGSPAWDGLAAAAASTYDSASNSAGGSTDTVQAGETSLSEVAERLHVDLGRLRQANQQIENPEALTPGQEIQVPPPPPPPPATDAYQPVQRGSGPPPAPPDPEAASAMKALLRGLAENLSQQASRPDADAIRWQQEQVGQVSVPDENSKEWQEQQSELDAVDRPTIADIGDQERENERVAAQQKLHDLGLPPDPPRVTAQDLANLKPEATTADKKTVEEEAERRREFQMEVGQDAIAHGGVEFGEKAIAKYTEKAAGMAVDLGNPKAAEGIEKIGGAGELACKAFSKAAIAATVIAGALDLIENGLEAGRARNYATIEMHGAALRASNELMQQKFPQSRPLNQRGIEQEKDVFNRWKDGVDGKLDDILKDVQDAQRNLQDRLVRSGNIGEFKEAAKQSFEQDMGDLKAKLQRVLEQATVDLTNARMAVYYDPRNWDESPKRSE